MTRTALLGTCVVAALAVTAIPIEGQGTGTGFEIGLRAEATRLVANGTVSASRTVVSVPVPGVRLGLASGRFLAEADLALRYTGGNDPTTQGGLLLNGIWHPAGVDVAGPYAGAVAGFNGRYTALTGLSNLSVQLVAGALGGYRVALTETLFARTGLFARRYFESSQLHPFWHYGAELGLAFRVR